MSDPIPPEASMKEKQETSREPAEMQKALDELTATAQNLEYAPYDADYEAKYAAARSALVALYNRQREEIERLKRVGLPEGLSEAIGTTGHIVERLHASQLTAEEAEKCLEAVEVYYQCSRPTKALRTKLSALRSPSKGKGE